MGGTAQGILRKKAHVTLLRGFSERAAPIREHLIAERDRVLAADTVVA